MAEAGLAAQRNVVPVLERVHCAASQLYQDVFLLHFRKKSGSDKPRKFSHDHVRQRKKRKSNKVKDYIKYEVIERKGREAVKDVW